MLNKLERKFGKYAINNLINYILGFYLIGYLLQFGSTFTNVNYISLVQLNPDLIIHNFQVWRIFSWLLVPPSTSMIWAIFMFIMYFQLGSILERNWGAFRFNVYIIGGILLTIIGAFITYGVLLAVGMGEYLAGAYIATSVSTYYINLSIFLAFACYYPDMQVLLYFIIPVKMKWMAIFYLVIIGYAVAKMIFTGAWFLAIPIVMSLLNFLIFYLSTRNLARVNPKEIHRRNEYKRQVAPPPTHYRDGSPIARHKCAVCGRTEISNPELEFRFCSKCNGNYEYCADHLFTHNHVI